MSRVHLTTKIEAPVDRVWKTVMNPDRLEDWVTIHRSVKAVSSRPLHEGSTMDQVLCLRGVSFQVHWTLVEVNPPTNAEWVGVGPAHSHARIRYELTADGDGATQVEYINEFSTPGGPLGTVASRVIVGAGSEREAEKSLRRLKALLEHLTGRTGCRMTEQAHEQHLAEPFLSMTNTHDRVSAAARTKGPTTRPREMTGSSIGYAAAPSEPGGSPAPSPKPSSPPSTTRS